MAEFEYRLKCKGVTGEEFNAILRGLKEEFPRGRTILRNPFWPQFDARTVHEVTLVLSGAAATLGAKTLEKAIEKALDLLAGAVERKLKNGNSERKKAVTIYGPDGKAALVVEALPERKRR